MRLFKVQRLAVLEVTCRDGEGRRGYVTKLADLKRQKVRNYDFKWFLLYKDFAYLLKMYANIQPRNVTHRLVQLCCSSVCILFLRKKKNYDCCILSLI